jgi:hypothetical protein
MSDHRTLDWAVDIIGMCEPIRCHQGGMWFGRNNNFADATFVDYGAADAFAVAAKTLPGFVKALAIIDGELKFYQEEHDRGNLTDLGRHAHSVLRGIRQRISAAVSTPGEPNG